MFGSSHQAYLEAPYVDAARQEAAFEAWCDRNDIDPDAKDAWDRFEQDMYDAADDAAIEAAENREDR